MLTLEQIAEGRRLAAEVDSGAPSQEKRVRLEAWLFFRCEALLDAAERVALAERARLGPEITSLAYDEVAPFPTTVEFDARRALFPMPVSLPGDRRALKLWTCEACGWRGSGPRENLTCPECRSRSVTSAT